jgi:hypothetical protein
MAIMLATIVKELINFLFVARLCKGFNILPLVKRVLRNLSIFGLNTFWIERTLRAILRLQ